MHRNRKKRNIVIFSLVGVLLCMVAGYAAFQTQLKVTGSSTVTSNWDIEITNVTEGIASGSAENTVKPSWDKLWASMEADLYDKGDSMEYDVTIENKGNIDAKLNDILTNVEKENNEAVIITFSGYTKGEILKANSSKLVHVKIEYNPEYEGGETSSEVEINFDYVQNNNETNNPDTQYLITYDYQTNGGTNADIKEEYYASGSNINPENTAYKEGWTFVGWNTDKDANIGLTNIEIKENTTLYAIYSKTLKVTYEKGENIESIGKVEDTCNIYNNNTTCEITLSSITPNKEYIVDGWYKENNKIGNPNDKYSIKEDNILISKAIEDVVSLSISTASTTNSITVVANAQATSGIAKYEYSKDGGKTWAVGTSNTYKFTNLISSTSYNIMVRVTSNSGKVVTSSRATTTGNLSISFSIKNVGNVTSATYGWAAQKKVTVNFSEICGQNGITCSYTHTQKEGTYLPTNEKVTVINTKSASYDYDTIGTMVATISNGTETKSATYTVTKVGNAATTLINKGVVSSGSGLYVDPYEASSTKDRFIYRGMVGNNYVKIDATPTSGWSDYFRIVAIEPDGTLKLMRNNVLYSDLQWSSSTSHRWDNSTLRSYINTNFKEYLNSKNVYASWYFSSNRYWYYGDIDYDANPNQTLNQTINAEKSLKISTELSPFGVLNMSDYIKASNNKNCKSIQDSRNGKCDNTWLWRDTDGVLATPSTNGIQTQNAVVGYIGWDGTDGVSMSSIIKTQATFNVRPAGYYVAHAHIISGSGTGENPYVLSTY